MDLVVADMAATTREKSQRGMASIRANMPVNHTHPGVAHQLMRNTVFLNRHGGRMHEVAYLTGLAASDWTWTVRLEDFDNDGNTDAYFTNGMAPPAFDHCCDTFRKLRVCPSVEKMEI